MTVIQRIILSTQWESPNMKNNRGSTAPDMYSVLACSAATRRQMELFQSSHLCEDRKPFFSHLKPQPLMKSTLKVVITQGTQMFSHYLNDQLKEDVERDELVAKGQLTRLEADEEADEWAEREWKKRWAALPRKIAVGLLKYHSVMFVIRLYESIAARFVSEVTLDKLTKDYFEASRRLESQGKSGTEMGKEMLRIGWNANIITYLADYSVHQVILLFGYYMYVQEQRKQRKEKKDDKTAIHSGSLIVSALKNSTLLALSRLIGLTFASVGGSLGSMIKPGWGTIAGLNLGDGLAITFTEEMVPTTAFAS